MSFSPHPPSPTPHPRSTEICCYACEYQLQKSSYQVQNSIVMLSYCYLIPVHIPMSHLFPPVLSHWLLPQRWKKFPKCQSSILSLWCLLHHHHHLCFQSLISYSCHSHKQTIRNLHFEGFPWSLPPLAGFSYCSIWTPLLCGEYR